MPDSESDSVSSHENVINDTSELSEVRISDEKGPAERRRMTVIEKNGYHDSVYIRAAQIFQGIHTEKRRDRALVRYGGDSVSAMVTLQDEHSQRAAYELAFSALKYQDLLEEILLDSCVYPSPSIPDELTCLLVVMLYDLQDRKFEPRKGFNEEEPVAEVQEIEHYLYSFRTKLAAAVARCRIKNGALSIEHILPEAIQKQQQRASALPLCVWVNTLKISLQDAFRDLKDEGFTRVPSVADLDRDTYCVDQHCHDVLFFPSSLKEKLLSSELFADCKLLLQDKSRSLAVHSVQAQLGTEDDVVVAHVGSHLTIAHLSALTAQSTSRIFVCGVESSAKADELRNLLSHMGCQNIHLLHEDFTKIEPTDPRLEKAKVILLLPQCSGLGVGNPIDFILNECGDAGLLRDIFRGSVSEERLRVLAEGQLDELRHALQFKVQAVVYCTCSVYPEENELVVKKALESAVEGRKTQPYRLIPPVFSPCSDVEASTETFFKMEPSDVSSGCFVAVLAIEKGPSESLSDILARAAAKGLLDGGVDKPQRGKKQKGTQKGTQKEPQKGTQKEPQKETHKGPQKGPQKVTQKGTQKVTQKVTQKGTQKGPQKEPQKGPQKGTHKGTQKGPQTEPQSRWKVTTSGAEPKITHLHQKTLPEAKAEASVSKAVSKAEEKVVNPRESSAQVKKPIQPASDTGGVPAAGKAGTKQAPGREARAERERLVLKPVDIVLPLGIPPAALPRNKARPRIRQRLRCWAAAKGSSGATLPQRLSEVVKPGVASHPRPWQ
ncbi:putative methyltransferase NSUN7 [Melanerpes formicivorus]|uniref:putative methyltransferase NSUN7 n=1 Tax=Melanerpes formicivorus TaxID=211600 RepID=UPI00358ED385